MTSRCAAHRCGWACVRAGSGCDTLWRGMVGTRLYLRGSSSTRYAGATSSRATTYLPRRANSHRRSTSPKPSTSLTSHRGRMRCPHTCDPSTCPLQAVQVAAVACSSCPRVQLQAPHQLVLLEPTGATNRGWQLRVGLHDDSHMCDCGNDSEARLNVVRSPLHVLAAV